MNRVLGERGQRPLERITQVYSQVDETLLLTYRELDHYPNREGQAGQVRNAENGPVPVAYRGAWTRSEGKAPRWPGGRGPKIYAYLKDFPALAELLGAVKELGCPAIVVVDGISREVVEKFRCGHIAFAREALDMQGVANECDLAILNAGHGTTAALLLAGKPVLLLPLYLEQIMLASAVRRMGAGLWASNRNGAQIVGRLRNMLEEAGRTQGSPLQGAAAAFARRYAGVDPLKENEAIVAGLESLMEREVEGARDESGRTSSAMFAPRGVLV